MVSKQFCRSSQYILRQFYHPAKLVVTDYVSVPSLVEDQKSLNLSEMLQVGSMYENPLLPNTCAFEMIKEPLKYQ